MHDTRPGHASQFRGVGQQRVQQGPAGMARRRVHHQARRLVDHQDRRILVQDIQPDGLGHPAVTVFHTGVDLQGFAGQQLFPGLFPLAVDGQLTAFDPLLQPRPGIVREQPGGGLVQADAPQLLGYLGL